MFGPDGAVTLGGTGGTSTNGGAIWTGTLGGASGIAACREGRIWTRGSDGEIAFSKMAARSTSACCCASPKNANGAEGVGWARA